MSNPKDCRTLIGQCFVEIHDAESAPDSQELQWWYSGSSLVSETREGCGCFRDLSGGSRGKLRESPGKIAGNLFPNREMLQILGFRAPGKANLPGTLGRHSWDLVCTFRAGCFLKSTVPAFSSSSDSDTL